MTRKILITKEDNWIWTWELEDDEIAEIHCSPQENPDHQKPALNSIYIGKVQNIVANIGAAFINIGGTNCYYDMSQAKNAFFTQKTGKKPLCIGDELVVQITKEAAKTKVPTVSSNISFTGWYAVLTSGNTRIGASAKIPKVQREELKEQLQNLKNEEYGIILRTNAKDAPFETVTKEIKQLQNRYKHLKETAMHRTCYSCLETAVKPYIADLKNVYLDGLKEIIIEDIELFEEVQTYFETEQPEYLSMLRKYEDQMLSLSALYNLKKVLERAMNERVWLKHGGYLVIQPTEALTVVDVNSGKDISGKNTAASYLKINLEAAREIAHQMRLRNLSGIILVDFINLNDEKAMQTLLKEFRYHLSKDPIQATLVDVTGLQLVEVTRKKVRKPLYEYHTK
ncbi:ribonuclease E/G [Mediterraneibacter agrestimuris]|uniref:ribonuclease E/G n=1 Tax=Mediterraneibacter agrestimuris TaxID=2941333 RepID=UPI00203C518B|nr:ribonuclease E/G [Mediterraneibacter agrestimuris]